MTTTKKLATRSWLLLLGLAGLSGLAGGCDRAHMSSYYGQSYNNWFLAQRAHADPMPSESTKRAMSSLDSQEASAISKNYRKAVGGQSDTGQGAGMVMIGQAPAASAAGFVPPPSVPGQ
jgi:hypothetical protein